MLALITRRRDAIQRLCRLFNVERLDVFGSATRADFDAESSDVDLVVRFREEQSAGLFDRYWGLLEGLEKILGRPVELLTERMIRNPYFRAAVEAERQTIYAGEPAKTVH